MKEFVLAFEKTTNDDDRPFFDRIVAKIDEDNYITLKREVGEVFYSEGEDGYGEEELQVTDWQTLYETPINEFDTSEIQDFCDYIKERQNNVKKRIKAAKE